MNVPSCLLWGFVATTIQTTLMSGAQGLGLSRMSFPFMLGTIFTPSRDRASLIGFGLHIVNGWLAAVLYALIFESFGRCDGWLGGLVGLSHGVFVLVVVMPLLPALHPRMASEHAGPEPTRALEPPGFLALNYGRWTPTITVVSHLIYGVVLGHFYRLSGG